MKEIVGFIRWGWNNFEFWQKAFILAMTLQLVSIPLSSPYNLYAAGIGMTIIVAFLAKWIFWDSMRASWAKYKAHRNELLTTIKDSHK